MDIPGPRKSSKVYPLEDVPWLEPTAITHFFNGKWSEPNLDDYVPAINLQKMYSITLGKLIKKGTKLPTVFSRKTLTKKTQNKCPGPWDESSSLPLKICPKVVPKWKDLIFQPSSIFRCELADSFREGKFLKISISRTASNSQGPSVRHESLHLSTMSSTKNSVKNGSKIGWSLLGMVLPKPGP